MMQNEMMRKLGIKYPIIQGGMREISGARLTAAVSAAGGLGTLGMMSDAKKWQDEIKRIKELTDRPFSVNLPLFVADAGERLDIIMAEGVKAVTTAAGNPARVMATLKGAGITVLHVVASVEQARKVAAAGVDIIVAEGGESGGMVAKDRVATVVLTPAVVDAVQVPVVAAGGLADARGLVAALALGAQGVQLGTRFIAAVECDASEEWKAAVCRAKDTDTQVVPRGSAQGRVLKDELLQGAMAGQSAALVQKIETVKEIMERMVREADQVFKRLAIQMRP